MREGEPLTVAASWLLHCPLYNLVQMVALTTTTSPVWLLHCPLYNHQSATPSISPVIQHDPVPLKPPTKTTLVYSTSSVASLSSPMSSSMTPLKPDQLTELRCIGNKQKQCSGQHLDFGRFYHARLYFKLIADYCMVPKHLKGHSVPRVNVFGTERSQVARR